MNFRDRTTSAYARIANIVKRMFMLKIDSPLRWRVRDADPEEVDDIEIFHNVGFHARPPAAGKWGPNVAIHNVEAIVVNVNSHDHPVIIATRDADTMRVVVEKVGLNPDETFIYNSKTIVKILADGTVEIRNLDGTAVPLALKSDVEALQARLDTVEQNLIGHVHLSTAPPNPTGAAQLVPPAEPPLLPTTPAVIAGTQTLKAE
jgi:hypothetical protein